MQPEHEMTAITPEPHQTLHHEDRESNTKTLNKSSIARAVQARYEVITMPESQETVGHEGLVSNTKTLKESSRAIVVQTELEMTAIMTELLKL